MLMFYIDRPNGKESKQLMQITDNLRINTTKLFKRTHKIIMVNKKIRMEVNYELFHLTMEPLLLQTTNKCISSLVQFSSTTLMIIFNTE